MKRKFWTHCHQELRVYPRRIIYSVLQAKSARMSLNVSFLSLPMPVITVRSQLPRVWRLQQSCPQTISTYSIHTHNSESRKHNTMPSLTKYCKDEHFFHFRPSSHHTVPRHTKYSISRRKFTCGYWWTSNHCWLHKSGWFHKLFVSRYV